jgi:hypothetical protein
MVKQSTDKRDDVQPTLSAFSKLLGFSKEQELKDWACDTLLPKLGAHLELLNALRDQAKVNASPNHDDVMDTIKKKHALISKNSVEFVKCAPLDVKTIWAHSVYIIRETIRHRPIIQMNYSKNTAIDSVAFDMIKMINKNKGPKRSFRPDFTPKWERARAELVKRRSPKLSYRA